MNDDLISRQAVIDILEKEGHKWGNDYRDWVDAIEEIKKLPSVNPQEPNSDIRLNRVNNELNQDKNEQEPKTGHWIFDDECKEHGHCSHCGYGSVDLVDGEPHNFCPKCGAWMIEPQESDHKCHTCKHYTSGEYDGSCGSYICKGYSDWESEESK